MKSSILKTIIVAALACATFSSMAQDFPSLRSGLGSLLDDTFSVPKKSYEAKATPIAESSHKITLEAAVLPGQKPRDPMTLEIRYKAPINTRMCVGYVGMEAVGLLRYMRRSTVDLARCTDVVKQVMTDQIFIKRLDVADGLLTVPDDINRLRDGFILVSVAINDEVSIFRIDSDYFKKSMLVETKSNFFSR